MTEKTLPALASSDSSQSTAQTTQPSSLAAPTPSTSNTATETAVPSQPETALFGNELLSSPLSSLVVPTVLGVLIFFSVVTWAALLIKGVQFSRFRRQNKQFSYQFWKSPDLVEGGQVARQSQGSLARIARVGLDVISGNDISTHRRELARKINRGERLERSLRQQILRERRVLEGGLAIVASIGSTAPFIGLFGTVWGIMEALVRIGITGEAGLDSVAGPIGHALIATGIGIAAAVPAVLVYNYFVRRFKLASGDMEAFAEEFYSLAQETGFSTELQHDGSGI